MAVDGKTRELTVEDMVPGAVIRLHQTDDVVAPFSDCVVIDRVAGNPGHYPPEWNVARPHPLGTDRFTVPETHLKHFRAVLGSRGQLYLHSVELPGIAKIRA